MANGRNRQGHIGTGRGPARGTEVHRSAVRERLSFSWHSQPRVSLSAKLFHRVGERKKEMSGTGVNGRKEEEGRGKEERSKGERERERDTRAERLRVGGGKRRVARCHAVQLLL